MLRIILSLTFFLMPLISYGITEDKPTLHFAGLFLLSQSDLSQPNNIKKEFKYLSIIQNDDTYYHEIADKLKSSLIEKQDFPFRITQDFGRISDNDGLAIGLVFSRENFIFLPFLGNKDEVLLDGLVVLNLIVFDFKKNVLLDFTPFPINFAEKFKSRSDAEQWIQNKMLKKHLLLNDEKFYRPLTKKLKSLKLDRNINRFQIRNVRFEPAFQSALEKDGLEQESQQIYIAQQLEAALSNYLPITLIPQKMRRGSIDDAQIGLLSLFSDRDNFYLKLPSPDYYFDITVRDFKMIRNPIEGDYRRVADMLSYGVFNTIEVKESKSNETKFIMKFFQKDSTLLRKDIDLESSENRTVKWGYFDINQFKLFLNFAEQIKEKNLAKLKTITNNENAIKEITILETLVNK